MARDRGLARCFIGGYQSTESGGVKSASMPRGKGHADALLKALLVRDGGRGVANHFIGSLCPGQRAMGKAQGAKARLTHWVPLKR